MISFTCFAPFSMVGNVIRALIFASLFDFWGNRLMVCWTCYCFQQTKYGIGNVYCLAKFYRCRKGCFNSLILVAESFDIQGGYSTDQDTLMSTSGTEESGSQMPMTGLPRNASEEFGCSTPTSITCAGASGGMKDSGFGPDSGAWYPSDGPDGTQLRSMNAAIQSNNDVMLQIPSRCQQGSSGGTISDCSEGESMLDPSGSAKDSMMAHGKRNMASSDGKDTSIALVDTVCGSSVDVEDSKDTGDELMVTPTGETIRLMKNINPVR